MRLTRWNRNLVGTQFGGSLYFMCDRFFVIMLMMRLGPAPRRAAARQERRDELLRAALRQPSRKVTSVAPFHEVEPAGLLAQRRDGAVRAGCAGSRRLSPGRARPLRRWACGASRPPRGRPAPQRRWRAALRRPVASPPRTSRRRGRSDCDRRRAMRRRSPRARCGPPRRWRRRVRPCPPRRVPPRPGRSGRPRRRRPRPSLAPCAEASCTHRRVRRSRAPRRPCRPGRDHAP